MPAQPHCCRGRDRTRRRPTMRLSLFILRVLVAVICIEKPAVADLSWQDWHEIRCKLWVISGHCRPLGRCPLYPHKRQLKLGLEMSAFCQKQTFCSAKKSLFD